MEEAKYYTPSIEEFHVGFEFEVKTGNIGDWNKVVFDGLTLNNGFPDIHEIYRVKHLDLQDIEWEGWKWDFDQPEFTQFSKGLIFLKFWQHKEKNSIEITNDLGNVVFYGNIRNASEFRKILKQLGIK